MVEIIPGKGSGQLKKRVLRFLEQKEIKALYHRVEKDSRNYGRSSSISAGSDGAGGVLLRHRAVQLGTAVGQQVVVRGDPLVSCGRQVAVGREHGRRLARAGPASG